MASIITATMGQQKIDICEMTYSAKGQTIQKAFSVAVPDGYIDDGKLTDVEGLATVLKEAFAAEGVVAKEITYIIKSSKIAYKEVYTPVLKMAKLKDMIKANASDYFPVNIEEYIITQKIVSQVEMAEGEKQLRVGVYAAAKEMIESYYELAKSLGLTVKNLESYSNATVSLLSKQIGPEVSVVIQVDDDSSTVNVFRNNVLELQRSVPYGKNVVVQAVMEEKDLSEEEAEKLIATERLIHNSFDGDEVTESLRYLINSIVRVVDYYTSRNNQNAVEKAYLTGVSVDMLGLENLFANEFEFSVMQIMEFNEVTIAPNLVLEPKMVSLYIANVGAVIDPINFVPESVEKEGKKDKSIKYLLLGLAASVVVGGVLILLPFLEGLSLQSDIEDMEEKIQSVKGIEIVMRDYYDSADKLRDVENFVALTSNANDYLHDFILALEKGMPSDVSIKSMSVNNGNVTISAVTSTKQSIAKFITQLNDMPGVGGVFVSSSSESKDEYGVVTSAFNIVCVFNSGIEYYVNPELSTEKESGEGEEE